jgi:hypothetical protein
VSSGEENRQFYPEEGSSVRFLVNFDHRNRRVVAHDSGKKTTIGKTTKKAVAGF